MRFFQLTQMTKGPRHLIAVTFHISLMRFIGTNDTCYVFRHTWLFCDTNNQLIYGFVDYRNYVLYSLDGGARVVVEKDLVVCVTAFSHDGCTNLTETYAVSPA